jgi:DNA repair photolyase
MINDVTINIKTKSDNEMAMDEEECFPWDDDFDPDAPTATQEEYIKMMEEDPSFCSTAFGPCQEKMESAPPRQAQNGKFGTREISDISINSMIGCANNCLYCYAAQSAVDKEYVKPRSAWAFEKVRKSMPDFGKKYPGRVMYPTSHDITPKHLPMHIKAVEALLAAGNEVLICSKARWSCLQEIAKVCANHKDKAIFMITITTLDETQSIFWEPNAPLPAERIMILEYLHQEGFRTSVLVEPLLQGPGSAIEIYNRVVDHVSEEIWFGTMNYVETRVDMSIPDNAKAAEMVKRYHSRENMRFLYDSMIDLPKVRFKRSIAVVGENK